MKYISTLKFNQRGRFIHGPKLGIDRIDHVLDIISTLVTYYFEEFNIVSNTFSKNVLGFQKDYVLILIRGF